MDSNADISATPAGIRDVTKQIEELERLVPATRRAELDTLDARGQQILRPQFHHVNIKTTRLDEMIMWYGTVVGVKVVQQAAGGAWLSNDGSNHRLALVTADALGTPVRVDAERTSHDGLLHTAWEYGSVDTLLTTYARLRDLGILPHRSVNHGPTLSFYYTDPDGNQVELQSDNFSDWSKSMAFMERGQRFIDDPFGPDVDPELMLRDRANGCSAAEVVERSYAGAYQTEEQRKAQQRRRQRRVAVPPTNERGGDTAR